MSFFFRFLKLGKSTKASIQGNNEITNSSSISMIDKQSKLEDEDVIPISDLIVRERERRTQDNARCREINETLLRDKIEQLNLQQVITNYMTKNRRALRDKIANVLCNSYEAVLIWSVKNEDWYKKLKKICKDHNGYPDLHIRNVLSKNMTSFLEILGADKEYYLQCTLKGEIMFRINSPPLSYVCRRGSKRAFNPR